MNAFLLKDRKTFLTGTTGMTILVTGTTGMTVLVTGMTGMTVSSDLADNPAFFF